MKFGTKYIMIIMIGLTGLFFMCGGNSAKEWTDKIVRADCEKTVSCMHESLKSETGASVQQAELLKQSIEECVTETIKVMGIQEERTLTSEEIGFAESCLDEIEQVNCNKRDVAPHSACNSLGKALENK
ncbi:MAG: hypothetical protein ABUK01_05650 [Leptospirales bacterium]